MAANSSSAVSQRSSRSPDVLPGAARAAPSSGSAAASPGRAGRRSPSPRRRPRSGRGTGPGSGRGSRPGCPPAGWSPPRATSSSASSRSIEPALHQLVVEALVRTHVGVLQVDQVQLGVVPVEAVAVAVATRAGRAWRPSRARLRTPSGRGAAGRAPTPSGAARRRSGRRRRRRSVSSTYLRGQLEVRLLQVERGHAAAVLEREQVLERGVVRDLVQRADGSVDGEVGADRPVLDHREHQRRRADLEVGGDLGEVGVADDDVQAAVLLGVGVRLVAGVDDRPLERRLEADLDLEVVGALADLEAVLAAVLADARRGRRRRPPGG